MSSSPLLAGASLDAALAWRGGQPISRRQFIADVRQLAQRLPETGAVLPMTNDRYRFALSIGAALSRGQPNLLPPNHTPDMMARLEAAVPGAYALADADAPAIGLPMLRYDDGPAPIAPGDSVPAIEPDQLIAQVFTSGTTGAPTRHAKRFDLLVRNVEAEAARLASHMNRASLEGVTIVGTVPAHHMYGFESTVMIALLCGAAFASERPFYPADIVAVIDSVPRPRLLVITPFHLKALIDSGVPLPPVDLILSATAPLSPQLAARAEAAMAAPLVEIYGCTEAGQVASRRTTAGDVWQTLGVLRIDGDGDACTVSGGHVAEPTPLADALEVVAPDRFRLLGRSNDLINVAGKRSSLAHLNFHLNSIEGVRDGAFWMPPAANAEDVTRPIAFVVAPELTRNELRAALRHRIDPVLLPRQVVFVNELPRDPTGKLPAARLASLAAQMRGEEG